MIENIYQADGCDSSPYRTYSLVDPTDMNQLIINNGKIPAVIGATEEKCVVPWERIIRGSDPLWREFPEKFSLLS